MPVKPELVVFTTKKTFSEKLASLKRSKLVSFSIENPGTIDARVSAARTPLMAYLDIGNFSSKEIENRIAQSNEFLKIGIIDSAGVVGDPAALLHAGAIDYIGKKLLQEGITAKRLKNVVEYCDYPVGTGDIDRHIQNRIQWKLSGSDWKNVKSGQEYTFCFMFVEIDLIDEWKRKSGAAHLDEVRSIFQKHIHQFAEQLSGKIWMWMDLGGLILFPFDGKRCDPILSGIRTVLNRTVISADHYRYNTLISYRTALHIGNTVYKSRGNTSTIVSDAVNFLFHFGHQFAQPGNFYLTEPVIPFIPEGFEDCFTHAGEFEDVEIRRMRLPVQ